MTSEVEPQSGVPSPERLDELLKDMDRAAEKVVYSLNGMNSLEKIWAISRAWREVLSRSRQWDMGDPFETMLLNRWADAFFGKLRDGLGRDEAMTENINPSQKRQQVVKSLWAFLREQQTRRANARSRPLRDPKAPLVSANLESVGESADSIMELFGYDPNLIPHEDGYGEDDYEEDEECPET